jgi:hypothetical protein
VQLRSQWHQIAPSETIRSLPAYAPLFVAPRSSSDNVSMFEANVFLEQQQQQQQHG